MNLKRVFLLICILGFIITSGSAQDSQLTNNTDTLVNAGNNTSTSDSGTVTTEQDTEAAPTQEQTVSSDEVSSEDTVSNEIIETTDERLIELAVPSDRLEAEFTGRDVQRITLNTIRDVNSGVVTVQRLKQRPDDVPLPGDKVKSKAYAYHNIYISGLDRSLIKDASVRFRVSLAWVRENRIRRDTIRLMRFHGGDWHELDTKILGVDEQYVYCEVSTGGFSIFAIVADTLGEGTDKPTKTASPTHTEAPDSTKTQTDAASRPRLQPGFGAVQFLCVLAVVSYVLRTRL